MNKDLTAVVLKVKAGEHLKIKVLKRRKAYQKNVRKKEAGQNFIWLRLVFILEN